MRRVLFVCTGNICRSPMAEAIARARAGSCSSVVFESAGIYALDGAPATGHAVRAASEAGADASGHEARSLTPEIVAAADEIYAMTADHRSAVVRLAPGAAGRVLLLDPSGRDIADPYGGSGDDYRAACAQISAAVDARVGDWAL
jgi:protein-tyrosine-phosphatase